MCGSRTERAREVFRSRTTDVPNREKSSSTYKVEVLLRSQEVFFQKYCVQTTAAQTSSYRRCGKKGEKSKSLIFSPFLQTAADCAICFFSLQNVSTLIKNSSRRR